MKSGKRAVRTEQERVRSHDGRTVGEERGREDKLTLGLLVGDGRVDDDGLSLLPVDGS